MSLDRVDVLEPGIARRRASSLGNLRDDPWGAGPSDRARSDTQLAGGASLPQGRSSRPYVHSRAVAVFPVPGWPASSPGCHPRRSPVRPAHAARWHRRARFQKPPWTCPTQSANVERSRSSPSRSKIWLWRYSGRWSAYLETRTCASRPGPGRPRSIGRDGRGACVKVSQPEQAMRRADDAVHDEPAGHILQLFGPHPRRGGEGFRRSAHSPRRRWSVRSPWRGM